MSAGDRRHLDPAGSQDPKNMAVAEQRYVRGSLGEGAADHSPGAVGRLIKRFTANQRRRPHGPIRIFLANFGSCATFVNAVVPLVKIHIDFSDIAESSQPAGFASAQERTGKHNQPPAAERVADEFGFALPFRRQPNIGTAGVLAGKRPFGLAVTHQEDLLLHSERYLMIACITAFSNSGRISRIGV